MSTDRKYEQNASMQHLNLGNKGGKAKKLLKNVQGTRDKGS